MFCSETPIIIQKHQANWPKKAANTHLSSKSNIANSGSLTPFGNFVFHAICVIINTFQGIDRWITNCFSQGAAVANVLNYIYGCVPIVLCSVSAVYQLLLRGTHRMARFNFFLSEVVFLLFHFASIKQPSER